MCWCISMESPMITLFDSSTTSSPKISKRWTVLILFLVWETLPLTLFLINTTFHSSFVSEPFPILWFSPFVTQETNALAYSRLRALTLTYLTDTGLTTCFPSNVFQQITKKRHSLCILRLKSPYNTLIPQRQHGKQVDMNITFNN